MLRAFIPYSRRVQRLLFFCHFALDDSAGITSMFIPSDPHRSRVLSKWLILWLTFGPPSEGINLTFQVSLSIFAHSLVHVGIFSLNSRFVSSTFILPVYHLTKKRNRKDSSFFNTTGNFSFRTSNRIKNQ